MVLVLRQGPIPDWSTYLCLFLGLVSGLLDLDAENSSPLFFIKSVVCIRCGCNSLGPLTTFNNILVLDTFH